MAARTTMPSTSFAARRDVDDRGDHHHPDNREDVGVDPRPANDVTFTDDNPAWRSP
ncbi:hypothetical protein ACM61V_08560 [Sphingomonas sp. TX0543]|uniref:hypothetical protein n=1 Tax=unclassified Sphingomonas TaxID=196159 RepID=UPI0014852AD3|nr:hypothetical protein [Sphingomonas sp. 3P27F8]